MRVLLEKQGNRLRLGIMNKPSDKGDRVESRRGSFDWSAAADQADSIIEDLECELKSRRQRRIAKSVYASTAVVALFVLWFGVADNWRPEPPVTVAKIAFLEPKTKTLSDGTVVDFVEDAKIAVEFSPSTRRVLLEAGVAHFQVAKNPDRPFVVVAGGIEVRAVGTAFSVERNDTGIEILVTEGRVAVELEDRSDWTEKSKGDLPIEAGSQIVVEGTGHNAEKAIKALDEAEMNSRLSWRIPRFEFDETPLAEVVRLFNSRAPKHGNPELVIADASLASMEISGTLRTDDVESLLWIVESEFEVSSLSQEGQIALSLR